MKSLAIVLMLFSPFAYASDLVGAGEHLEKSATYTHVSITSAIIGTAVVVIAPEYAVISAISGLVSLWCQWTAAGHIAIAGRQMSQAQFVGWPNKRE